MQASDEFIVDHKADNTDIVLFLFKGSSAISGAKKKVCCRLCVWSAVALLLIVPSFMCCVIKLSSCPD